MAIDKLIWKILFDFFMMICAAFPILAIYLWVTPHITGYVPDDPSLRLPFKEQRVPVLWLALGGFIVMIVTVLITEIKVDKQGSGIGEKFLCNMLIPGWAWESYRAMGIFAFGVICQQIVCDTTKNVLGELRPHFFDLCKPVPNATSILNTDGYIQDYTCSNSDVDSKRFTDMRRSMPSAHTSFSMYCAVFFIMYLQERGKWRGSKMMRHVLQLLAFIAASFVSASRISDNMHHLRDVIGGLVIGVATAVLVFIYVLKPKMYGLPIGWQQETSQNNTIPRPVLR